MNSLIERIKTAEVTNDSKSIRTLRTIDQMLRSQSIPLSQDEFSISNMLKFLDDINDPVKYPQMIIGSWESKIFKNQNPAIQAAFKEQMEIYYQSYLVLYNGDSQKALATTSKIKDLYENNYKKLDSDIKKIDRNRYVDSAGNYDNAARQADIQKAVTTFTERTEKLNLYSELVTGLRSEENKAGYSQRNINIIFGYDNYQDFDLDGPIRETTLREYLEIIEAQIPSDATREEATKIKNKAEFLNYIFKSKKIPFAPEGTPITVSNINSFLAKTDNVERFFEFKLQDLAHKSRLENYPSTSNNIYNAFVQKFMDYKFNNELTDGQIMQCKYLFDNLKSKNPQGFDLNQLDFYVNALKQELNFGTILKFINKLDSLPTSDKVHYMSILLSDENTDEMRTQKETILQFLEH